MLRQKVATVVLAIRTAGCDAEETSDGGRQIFGTRCVTVRKVGEELAYEPRNARVVATCIPACAFNHSGIDSDVQAFLGHDASYAHDFSKTIRILGGAGNGGGFRGDLAGRAEVGCGTCIVLQRLTIGPRLRGLRPLRGNRPSGWVDHGNMAAH